MRFLCGLLFAFVLGGVNAQIFLTYNPLINYTQVGKEADLGGRRRIVKPARKRELFEPPSPQRISPLSPSLPQDATLSLNLPPLFGNGPTPIFLSLETVSVRNVNAQSSSFNLEGILISSWRDDRYLNTSYGQIYPGSSFQPAITLDNKISYSVSNTVTRITQFTPPWMQGQIYPNKDASRAIQIPYGGAWITQMARFSATVVWEPDLVRPAFCVVWCGVAAVVGGPRLSRESSAHSPPESRRWQKRRPPHPLDAGMCFLRGLSAAA